MTKRPLSPHLQIYRLPLNAWLSITHRITGFAINGSYFVLILLLLVLLNGEKAWSGVEPLFGSFVFKGLVYLSVLAILYHMFNGIRHLLWDNLVGLEKNQVVRTSWLVIICTLISFIYWMLSL